MFYGPNVVAQVWSLTNKNQDIPYLIKREGKPKSQGGSGYKWSCTCPSYVYSRTRTCKHIIGFRKIKLDSIPENYFISEFGMEILF